MKQSSGPELKCDPVNWFSNNRPGSPVPVILDIETYGTDYRFTDFNEQELYGWPGDYEMTGVTVTVMADMGEEEFSRPVLSRLHLSTPEEMAWAPKVGTEAVSGLVITVGHGRGTTRKLALGAGELPLISIGAEGVMVGRQLVGWENGEWEDDWDSGDDIEVYWRGKPVGGPHVIGIHEWRAALGPLADCIPAEVNLALYMAMTVLPEWRRELIFGLLQELDYLIHHGDTSPFASSPEAFILAMTSDPERILHLALTVPRERARHIRGPASLMLWLQENHSESPQRKGPSLVTGQHRNQSSHLAQTMDSSSPFTPEGEIILNAMLVTMKVKGVLTDEFISAQEGEILLNQPFLEWPKELQQKLIPYGASPAIR
jgi:hypothetical protein